MANNFYMKKILISISIASILIAASGCRAETPREKFEKQVQEYNKKNPPPGIPYEYTGPNTNPIKGPTPEF